MRSGTGGLQRPSRRAGSTYQLNAQRLLLLGALAAIGFLGYQRLSYSGSLKQQREEAARLLAERAGLALAKTELSRKLDESRQVARGAGAGPAPASLVSAAVLGRRRRRCRRRPLG